MACVSLDDCSFNRPLLVRHLEVRVNGKGVAEVTGNYTRSQRDVNNTLDMEKRLFARPVPLEASM